MAVRKKEKKAEEGAPAWMVTYGDMVTLLLTFFVMLLAMSEVKKDDRFIDFMQAIREAFGYVGGVEHLPLDPDQIPRNVNLTDMLIIPVHPHDMAKSQDEGIRGQNSTVTNIRHPEIFDVGGKVRFAALSAALDDEQRDHLLEFAERMRGYQTQIEVSGHCSRTPVTGTAFTDHFELAWQRARSVAEVLEESGIDAGRIVIRVAATNEPVTTRAYTAAEREQNDFVQILQINKRVDEF